MKLKKFSFKHLVIVKIIQTTYSIFTAAVINYEQKQHSKHLSLHYF
jgi:hypothetical protein